MELKEIKIPKNIGSYIIGSKKIENSIRFNFQKKPSWIHRTFSRILLGWYWIDEDL